MNPHLRAVPDSPPDPLAALHDAMDQAVNRHLDALAIAEIEGAEAARLAKVIAPGIAHELERFGEARRVYVDRIVALQKRLT